MVLLACFLTYFWFQATTKGEDPKPCNPGFGGPQLFGRNLERTTFVQPPSGNPLMFSDKRVEEGLNNYLHKKCGRRMVSVGST